VAAVKSDKEGFLNGSEGFPMRVSRGRIQPFSSQVCRLSTTQSHQPPTESNSMCPAFDPSSFQDSEWSNRHIESNGMNVDEAGAVVFSRKSDPTIVSSDGVRVRVNSLMMSEASVVFDFPQPVGAALVD
jgi:hypothetical protein